MANKYYVVELTSEERKQLKRLISIGKTAAYKQRGVRLPHRERFFSLRQETEFEHRESNIENQESSYFFFPFAFFLPVVFFGLDFALQPQVLHIFLSFHLLSSIKIRS
jgi:hypothetical protein